MPGIRDLRKIQIGQETYGSGAPVAPTAQLVGQLNGTEDRGRVFVSEASGIMSSHRRTYDTSVIANLDYDAGDEGATFEQLIYLLSMGVCGGVTPVVTGVLGRTWTYTPNLTAGNFPDIYTLKWGDNQYVWMAEGVAARNLSISAASQEPWQLSAGLFGDQLAPSSYEAGITYPDPLETIKGQMTQIYIDNTGAGIGTTPISATLIGWSVEIPGFHEKFFQDGQLTPSARGLASRALTCTFNFEFNSYATAEWLYWRAGTKRFVRIEALGSIIEGVLTKKATIDMCLEYEGHGNLEDRDGNDTMSFTGRTIYDATWGKDFEVAVVNSITAYP